jgi:hypothetical protein
VKGDELRALAQDVPQQIRERQQHTERRLNGRRPEAPQLRHDVVERVEEKMRIELLAQGLQPGLGHFRAQPLGHFGLPAAGLGDNEPGGDGAVENRLRQEVRSDRAPVGPDL